MSSKFFRMLIATAGLLTAVNVYAMDIDYVSIEKVDEETVKKEGSPSQLKALEVNIALGNTAIFRQEVGVNCSGCWFNEDVNIETKVILTNRKTSSDSERSYSSSSFVRSGNRERVWSYIYANPVEASKITIEATASGPNARTQTVTETYSLVVNDKKSATYGKVMTTGTITNAGTLKVNGKSSIGMYAVGSGSTATNKGTENTTQSGFPKSECA